MIPGKKISLRALEPNDLDLLYRTENDTALWQVGHTQVPYSKHILKEYLENAHRDIYEVKQLRLVIAEPNGRAVGLVDLYDFDPKNKRVGIGIVITDPTDRQKGYASEAISLACDYALQHLQVHQVYASVGADNTTSIRLFEKLSFVHSGTRKDWNFYKGTFHDERIYQKILTPEMLR